MSFGVVTDMSMTHATGEVRLRIRGESRAKALALVTSIRATRPCQPATASKLRGQLGYVTSQGKTGRAVLQCLKNL